LWYSLNKIYRAKELIRMKKAIYLKELNTVQVEALLQREAPLFIPMGTLEPHGRHLPVGTDTLCAEKVAEHLSIAFDGVIAPSFEYGLTNVFLQTSPSSFSLLIYIELL
jgi:creatinine amidohydrolase/Fe(II)-dependent formamide hydrolase-like protein